MVFSFLTTKDTKYTLRAQRVLPEQLQNRIQNMGNQSKD